MKNFILAIVGLIGVVGVSPVFSTDVGIDVFLHRLAYSRAESVGFNISGFNRENNSELVDVHIAVIAADGTIYEYPDWNTNLKPWLPSFTLPASFELPATLLDNLDSFPGNIQPGSYKLAVALTSPGTLNLLSFNSRSFKILSLKNTVTQGGISFAHGSSFTGLSDPVADAAGGFLSVKTEDIDSLKLIVDQTTPNIEQCLFFKTPTTFSSTLDAGASLLLSSTLAGEVDLNKLITNDGSTVYGGTPPIAESFYLAGQSYTVSGTGGADIAAFSVSAVAPGEIIVTEPDLATLDIDSSQDLTLRWQGNNSVGEIGFVLQGGTGDNSHRITCRFADDGEAMIASSLLVQLRDVVANDTLPIPDIPGIDLADLSLDSVVNLVFARNRFEFINNNDEDSTLFLTSWAASAIPKIH